MTDQLGRRAVLSAAALTGLAACAKDDPQASSPSKTGNSQQTSDAPATTGSQQPTPPPSSVPAKKREITFVMSGDLLWHNTVWMSAQVSAKKTGKGAGGYDFDPMFELVKPIIEGADLSIAHCEVPFQKRGGTPSGYPSFAAPAEIVDWMPTMGWDIATTASNHSLDQGFDGLVRSHEMIEQAGLKALGTYPTKEAKDTPFIVEKNGIKVSIVSGTYDLNGYVPPAGKEWCVDMWDVDRMIADAKAARKAGADIVLAHLHGGDEYVHMPNADQVQRVKALTAAPEIDMVFGQHAHVVQPITKVNDTWVVYGMGNMVAQHLTTVPRGYEGITVRFTLTERDESPAGKQGRFAVTKAEYLPVLITSFRESGECKLYPVTQCLKDGTGPQERLKIAQEQIRKAVTLLDPPADLLEI